MHKTRLLDLDRAKGLAIFLVVIGHLWSGPMPASAEWYPAVKDVIYRFHMPIFIWISGFIAAYTYKGVSDWEEYFSYIGKRWTRLLPAFFLVTLLVLAGKLVFQNLMQVDHPISQVSDLFGPFLRPYGSVVTFIWYVYVLLEFYLLYPVLMAIFKGRAWLAAIFVFPLRLLDVTGLFALDKVCEYLFFFMVGAATAQAREQFIVIVEKFGLALFVGFIGVLAVDHYYELPMVIVGLTAIPAVHYIVSRGWLRHSETLLLFGEYVFPIYLFSMFFMGFTKGVMLDGLGMSLDQFWIIAPVLTFVGLAGPILLKKFVLVRFPLINKWAS